MKTILVTGGAGYIGSHTVVELVSAGYRPVIVDNFDNSEKGTIMRLEKLLKQQVTYYDMDYQNTDKLAEIISTEGVDGVIHFAAFKAVGESVERPLKYYDNNVSGFVSLLETLQSLNIQHFVFSSSAAVYGSPPDTLVNEATVCKPTSPYGWSKLMDEVILKDFCTAYPDFGGISLRYFNVVGSHESYIIGELGKGKPENLLPIIVQATAGTIKPLTIYGNDYPTKDGTCERDYVHVVDLARAHVAALNKLEKGDTGYRVYNIGTGKPTSVLELIHTFETVNDIKVPYSIGGRRQGDPAAYYASADKAQNELEWSATKTTEDAVRDAWTWYKTVLAENPS